MAEATEDTRTLNITVTKEGEEPEDVVYQVKDFDNEQLTAFNKLEIVQNSKQQLIAKAQFDVECQTVLEKHFSTVLHGLLNPSEETDDGAEETDE
tara:strand:- start:4053 stop:4337 length:285 start_codon:yes stop_codon:yes gene_type:complete